MLSVPLWENDYKFLISDNNCTDTKYKEFKNNGNMQVFAMLTRTQVARPRPRPRTQASRPRSRPRT